MAPTRKSDKKCAICKDIDKRLLANECSGCELIFHNLCLLHPMKPEAFGLLGKNGTWKCPNCITPQTRTLESLADLNLATEKPEEKHKESPELWTSNVSLVPVIKPEDLHINMKNHVLTIELKTEQVSEDGSSRSYTEFSKNIAIPGAVNLKEIKTVLQPDGTLNIEAPLVQPEVKPVEEPKPMEIRVHFDD